MRTTKQHGAAQVGNGVWYYPGQMDPGHEGVAQTPLVAMVVHVTEHPDGERVNLVIFDRQGNSFGRTEVVVFTGPAEQKPAWGYAVWPDASGVPPPVEAPEPIEATTPDQPGKEPERAEKDKRVGKS